MKCIAYVALLLALIAMSGCAQPTQLEGRLAALEARTKPEIDATVRMAVDFLCNMRVKTMAAQLDTDDKALGAYLLCPELRDLVDKINEARDPTNGT